MGFFRMTVKAESGDTGNGMSVPGADEPPGFGPPMHIHRDAGEAFYVLDGEYVPAAMVGYFDELADAHRLSTPLDPTSLAELADRYSMQVTGDVPEGYV